MRIGNSSVYSGLQGRCWDVWRQIRKIKWCDYSRGIARLLIFMSPEKRIQQMSVRQTFGYLLDISRDNTSKLRVLFPCQGSFFCNSNYFQWSLLPENLRGAFGQPLITMRQTQKSTHLQGLYLLGPLILPQTHITHWEEIISCVTFYFSALKSSDLIGSILGNPQFVVTTQSFCCYLISFTSFFCFYSTPLWQVLLPPCGL